MVSIMALFTHFTPSDTHTLDLETSAPLLRLTRRGRGRGPRGRGRGRDQGRGMSSSDVFSSRVEVDGVMSGD